MYFTAMIGNTPANQIFKIEVNSVKNKQKVYTVEVTLK